MVQVLSSDLLVRLLRLDRCGDDDSWLLFGPGPPAAADASEEHEPLRWAAE